MSTTLSNNAVGLTPIVDITSNFSVSGALTKQDFSALIEKGITTLINVRPDNECENQINDLEWQDLANKYKIEYAYIPVKPNEYNDDDIARFASLLNNIDKKVHGFCRTGTRAAHLWALANKNKIEFLAIQYQLSNKGYSVSSISEMFDNT